MAKGKWVMTVSKKETLDGMYHVDYCTGKRTFTKRFRKWKNAIAFARKKAKKMGLEQKQIIRSN